MKTHIDHFVIRGIRLSIADGTVVRVAMESDEVSIDVRTWNELDFQLVFSKVNSISFTPSGDLASLSLESVHENLPRSERGGEARSKTKRCRFYSACDEEVGTVTLGDDGSMRIVFRGDAVEWP